MKGKATTILTVCPLRRKADDASEMISQLLFGETVSIIAQQKDNWCKIKVDHDGYEGWIDQKQLIRLPSFKETEVSICVELFEKVFADKATTWVTLGAEFADFDGMVSRLGDHRFRFSGQAIKAKDMRPDPELIEKLAKRLLNTPYLWGGRTPLGIDCSGFSQLVFKCAGIPILRDAKDQATQGETIDFVSTAKPGDLAFFTKKTDKISHVGIVLGNMDIIHASGNVRIDKLDHYGIYNTEIEEYTHRLKIIKRYF